MKTVINKSRGPIKLLLPRGKSLHLGPGRTGQIADGAEDRPAIKKLIEQGTIEVYDEVASRKSGGGDGGPRHASTQTQGKSSFRTNKGDRGA